MHTASPKKPYGSTAWSYIQSVANVGALLSTLIEIAFVVVSNLESPQMSFVPVRWFLASFQGCLLRGAPPPPTQFPLPTSRLFCKSLLASPLDLDPLGPVPGPWSNCPITCPYPRNSSNTRFYPRAPSIPDVTGVIKPSLGFVALMLSRPSSTSKSPHIGLRVN